MANALEGRGGIQLWRSKPRQIDDDMSNAGTSSSTLIKLNWSMVKLSLLSLSAAPRLIVRWRFHEDITIALHLSASAVAPTLPFRLHS